MKSKDPRFWRKVEKAHSRHVCWTWQGARDRDGYGRVARRQFGEKPMKAHRFAFFLFYGRWPEGECTHSCDNKACMKPAHLFDDVRRAAKQKPVLNDYLERYVQEMQERYVKGSRMNGVPGLADDYGLDIKITRKIVKGTLFENMYGGF